MGEQKNGASVPIVMTVITSGLIRAVSANLAVCLGCQL
jgi:hypothetical protein